MDYALTDQLPDRIPRLVPVEAAEAVTGQRLNDDERGRVADEARRRMAFAHGSFFGFSVTVSVTVSVNVSVSVTVSVSV